MTATLHLAALGLYALAALLLGIALARGGRRLPAVATAVTGAAVAAHVSALVAYRAQWGELPLVGLGPSLSFLALVVGLGSLGVATLGRTGPLGLVLVPVAAVLAGAAEWTGLHPLQASPLVFQGPWFVLHVVLAMLGYTGLIVAFAAGLMYLLQFRELKNKHFGAVFRFFPPLDTLDRMGKAALIVGMAFLSLALLVGWAWTERFNRPLGAGNPKVVWGVLSWIVFAAALGVRAGGGMRELRAAMAAVFGFAVVVVSYVLLRLATIGGGFL